MLGRFLQLILALAHKFFLVLWHILLNISVYVWSMHQMSLIRHTSLTTLGFYELGNPCSSSSYRPVQEYYKTYCESKVKSIKLNIQLQTNLFKLQLHQICNSMTSPYCWFLLLICSWCLFWGVLRSLSSSACGIFTYFVYIAGLSFFPYSLLMPIQYHALLF